LVGACFVIVGVAVGASVAVGVALLVAVNVGSGVSVGGTSVGVSVGRAVFVGGTGVTVGGTVGGTGTGFTRLSRFHTANATIAAMITRTTITNRVSLLLTTSRLPFFYVLHGPPRIVCLLVHVGAAGGRS
jgi:hypothetical protein